MKAIRFAERLKPLLVPLDSVQQHPANPNNGDVDSIIESIKVNGFNSVVTVDERTGYIIAGNHRYQALHALGATEIPVIYATPAPDGDERRYMLADNQTARLARMDQAAELEILKELAESEIGLFGTGFTDELMQQLMLDLANQAEIPMGGGMDTAPSGIYQIIIDFDNADDRDAMHADLVDRYEGTGTEIRTANL